MPRKRQDQTAQTPLTPAELYILLSLADGEKHGYAILQGVDETSNGKIKLNTGTLYRAIKRLLDAGLIGEAERPAEETVDERRKYYYLADDGRRAASDEVARLEQIVREAQRTKLLAKPVIAMAQGA
jgi:DNA-binding PadR family transcriptional regulator